MSRYWVLFVNLLTLWNFTIVIGSINLPCYCWSRLTWARRKWGGPRLPLPLKTKEFFNRKYILKKPISRLLICSGVGIYYIYASSLKVECGLPWAGRKRGGQHTVYQAGGWRSHPSCRQTRPVKVITGYLAIFLNIWFFFNASQEINFFIIQFQVVTSHLNLH